jgi:tetratricopeptide (TPR) repeat protein
MSWLSPRRLVVAGGVVLVLAALGLGGWWWADANERRAAAAYAEPLGRLAEARAGTLTPEARAAIANDLEAAMARFPSAALAAQAAWEIGNMRYAERAWERARRAWAITLARSPSPTLRTLARASIGYAWEAEANLPKATEAYQAALAGLRPGDFDYEEVLMALARVQESAGDKAQAAETYRRLLREVPQGLRVDDARSRLASLGAAP